MVFQKRAYIVLKKLLVSAPTTVILMEYRVNLYLNKTQYVFSFLITDKF